MVISYSFVLYENVASLAVHVLLFLLWLVVTNHVFLSGDGDEKTVKRLLVLPCFELL